MTVFTVARGFFQLVILLTELTPVMLKLWRAWQRENGRLSAPERRRIAGSVKQAVKSKDTENLEAFLIGSKAQ